MPPQKILKSRGSEMLFYAFLVALVFRKVNLEPKSRRGNCLVLPNASYSPVKRSMYVDDMMKAAVATKKAVNLEIQLRRLLENGSFPLRKC